MVADPPLGTGAGAGAPATVPASVVPVGLSRRKPIGSASKKFVTVPVSEAGSVVNVVDDENESDAEPMVTVALLAL